MQTDTKQRRKANTNKGSLEIKSVLMFDDTSHRPLYDTELDKKHIYLEVVDHVNLV